MEITKNQYVLFTELDGTIRKVGYLEIRYSNKQNSFYVFSNQDENIKLFSNTIIDKPIRKKREYTKQTDISKMKEIFPIGENEKSYIVYDGANGKITRGNTKQYYKYYAKSICVVDNNRVYAPIWA
ncbi:MAG TPA: hypothetical protein GX708_02385 [Gallicola sp.]|nr:hypothetical protein [Gallicola sp.]